ncbi:hypothetical protein Tco_0511283 [Tanacetum coccineum]
MRQTSGMAYAVGTGAWDRRRSSLSWGNETLIVHSDGINRGNEARLHIISYTKKHEYILKGCPVFLANVTTKETGDKSEKKRLEDVPIVRDFPDVFPEGLSGLPLTRQVEFQINLIPSVAPVAWTPYRLTPSEMKELSEQLKELSKKGFIRPNSSPWGAPVLFVKKKDGLTKRSMKNIKAVLDGFKKQSCMLSSLNVNFGFLRYYRRFIKGFSKIANSMTKLTQKGVKFDWGDKQEAAFQLLKQKNKCTVDCVTDHKSPYNTFLNQKDVEYDGCIVVDKKSRVKPLRWFDAIRVWTIGFRSSYTILIMLAEARKPGEHREQRCGGRKLALSFMRPFRYHVTILNTLDHLGKFNGKADEGFFVGYSMNSKAFRVFNSRTRIVRETLHITFLENKSNIVGSGPEWIFDIDTLTKSMNYESVVTGNQSNDLAGTKACENAGKAIVETIPGKDYILLPILTQDLPFSSSSKDSPDAGFKPSGEEEKKDAKHLENKDSEVPNIKEPRVNQEQDESVKSTNNMNTVSSTVNTASIEDNDVDENTVYECADDLNMPNLEEIVYSEDDEGVGVEANMNNLDTYMPVNPIPTTKIHKDHPFEQIIRDLHSAPQTRRMTKSVTEHGIISSVQQRINHKDFQNCLFACFLSQVELKKVIQELKDLRWIEAIQEKLLSDCLDLISRINNNIEHRICIAELT